MTTTTRAALLTIARLIIAARVEVDEEIRNVALDEAVRRLAALARGKPYEPKSGRYQLVDMAKGNGVELEAGEVARLVEALGPGDEELREKLRGL